MKKPYKVDKNIPLPVKSRTAGAPSRYPFIAMGEGDSFFVSSEVEKDTVRYDAKKDQIKITVAKEGNGYRIWRLFSEAARPEGVSGSAPKIENTTSYAIKKVAITRSARRPRSELATQLAELEIGGSIAVPAQLSKNAYVAACVVGIKVATRRVGESCRIWRLS